MLDLNRVHCGDLADLLPRIDAKSINAIVTSPPYADQRKHQYGGISEADYPDWTVEWMRQARRVLADDGNVAIVIRPHVKDGQISDYVLRTRLALRSDGWKECDELIWIKPGAPPLGHKFRPRRSWESILWFSTTGKSYCDPVANGAASDRIGMESVKGVGNYIVTSSACRSGIARSRDYVEVSTASAHKQSFNNHPAQYPVKLAEWIINLLCPPSGVVLDPFMGSGSTAVAALNTGRRFIGCELKQEYIDIANQRIMPLLADPFFPLICDAQAPSVPQIHAV